MSYAIRQDIVTNADHRLLVDYATWPFLWRSFASRLRDTELDVLIDGRNLGYIASSYWNDPLYEGNYAGKLQVRSPEPGASATVSMPTNPEATFEVSLPISLFGQARNCQIDVHDVVRLEGTGVAMGRTVFDLRDDVYIRADELAIEADNLVLSGGTCWLDAAAVTLKPQLSLILTKDANYGWGQALAQQYPWNRHPSTLVTPINDALTRIINICASRLSRIPLYLVEDDLSVPENSAEMQWARREGAAFATVLSSMLQYGLASSEPQQAAGAKRLTRIVFDVPWDDIAKAVMYPSRYPALAQFVTEVRAAL
jgi:hypothetical protein